MGFEKAIEHGKTKRHAYHGPKAVDASCRNHGGCPTCGGNRRHHNTVREMAADDQLKDLAK